MSIQIKRLIFWGLFVLFVLDTAIIYVSENANNPGAQYLTQGAKKGKLIFQEKNCVSCHQVYGLGGYMGPDLTNVMSAPGKGDLYVKAFIQNGTARMPNFHLSERDINDLAEYLRYVDKTGISPLRNFHININGTISW